MLTTSIHESEIKLSHMCQHKQKTCMTSVTKPLNLHDPMSQCNSGEWLFALCSADNLFLSSLSLCSANSLLKRRLAIGTLHHRDRLWKFKWLAWFTGWFVDSSYCTELR